MIPSTNKIGRRKTPAQLKCTHDSLFFVVFFIKSEPSKLLLIANAFASCAPLFVLTYKVSQFYAENKVGYNQARSWVVKSLRAGFRFPSFRTLIIHNS